MYPGVLPGHTSNQQSHGSQPVKGSKITEAPRICTAAPTTANRPAPSPAAPANRKPVTHRAAATAGRGAGLGAQAKPAHAALDAMADGVRTAFGRAATTAAISQTPGKQGSILTIAKVPSGSAAAPMHCTDKCVLDY